MKIHLFLLVLVLAFSQAACLKTRAQLRDEGSTEDSRSQPAQSQKLQDVQPQGQYVIDEIKSEITRITGRVEDLERTQQDAKSAGVSKENFKSLETRIIELEQAQAAMIDAMKKGQETHQAQLSATDPVELYEKGKVSFDSRNYEAAVEAFTAYLQSPKAKTSVEKAYYGRGEAYMQLKEFKKAIVDFSKVTEKFPKSPRNPSSLLKIGQCFDALGLRDDAKSFYQEVVEKFPKTPEAKKARLKLK